MIDINEMTVLIADDIPNMITTLRNMMKVLKYGKRFIPADNGEEAWRILNKEKEEPVELAILDYNMPVMNGAELLSLLPSRCWVKKSWLSLKMPIIHHLWLLI
jgi:CheY-like chemotaxis protein